jgi:hypothetical protein
MELPHPGEPRKVQPPSQRTLSRQLMRAWSLWQTNIATDSNTRLEQLVLLTPMTFHSTSEQDLNPRSCEVNDQPSVLAHEMMVIEPGGNPTYMLTWKPTSFQVIMYVGFNLVLTMITSPYLCGRQNFVKVQVFPFQTC